MGILDIIREYMKDDTIIINLDKFKVLLENDIININKSTTFKWFCDKYLSDSSQFSGDTKIDDLINIWIVKKIDFNITFNDDSSVLSYIYAICDDKMEVTKQIVQTGFSFKECNLPLLYMHNYKLSENTKIAEAIMNQGYNLKNIFPVYNPIYLICQANNKNEHTTLVKYLLKCYNKFDKEYSPLNIAILYGHTEYVKLLLESGAILPPDFDVKDEEIKKIITNHNNSILLDKCEEIKLSMLEKNLINQILNQMMNIIN